MTSADQDIETESLASASASTDSLATVTADPRTATDGPTSAESAIGTATETRSELSAADDPQDPRFRRFWLGDTVSQLGDRVTELALPLIAAATLKASAAEASALAAVTWTPNLLGVFLGAWVDRQRRERRLMIGADLARAAVLVSLPVAAAFHAVTLGQLYVVAALCGTAAVLFNTSYPSFFARLVPRSQYVSANSKLAGSRSASFMVGPAVGGVLTAAASAPFAVAADSVSFLFSALMISRVRVAEPESEPQPESDSAEVSLARRAKEGILYIAREPILRSTLACATTVNFFTFVANTSLLILFATRVLHLSGGAVGVALGVGASGALLGAVLAPRLARRIGVGRGVAVGAVLFPAPIALVAVAHGSVWLCAGVLALAEFLGGLGVMLFDVNLNSLQTAVIHDTVRSRVSGAYTTVNYGIRPLGAVVGGVLAGTIGMRPTLLVAAVGGAMSALWLLTSPVLGIRSLENL
ncbi:MFS transporter [Catenulispora rubra]|uniref:MFS transporter n=1 Tax=Catenulispora rubra TaxID=280293 RepID=UPI0018921698|nr:MFS transporter [Catenulispora rubra]